MTVHAAPSGVHHEPPLGPGPVDEAAIYAERFPDAVLERRHAMWQEIARHLQRYVPVDSVVLDIGAGEGYLVASLEARERWALDLRPPWEPLLDRVPASSGAAASRPMAS